LLFFFFLQQGKGRTQTLSNADASWFNFHAHNLLLRQFIESTYLMRLLLRYTIRLIEKNYNHIII
ncbi:hypothetical protein ACJX0J_022095, partial [Zea mays]